MSKFIIKGGKPLNGEVRSIGNKNAILKMIPATLLTSEEVTITNVPAISDVKVMLEIMKDLGTTYQYDEQNEVLKLQTQEIKTSRINFALALKLRASNMFLGPVLARLGTVTNVFPGGDKIGTREMNAHFDGFEKLGAKFEKHNDNSFTLSGKLSGNEVFLYEPSVTATENIILAAVLAEGETIIKNAASEPHVQELCLMLNQMGASITGIGTNTVIINGVESLSGTTYAVPPDHIYVGTMVVLAVITGGELLIKNVNHEDMKSILYFYEKLGVRTENRGNDLFVPANQNLEVEDVEWARTKGVYCQPWPCFPTDMMSVAIVLATQVKGTILFFEKMYAGRMFFANYLNGMSANIILADPHRIIINGKTQLKGQQLQSPDLRAGMAYVAAGLCAQGETVVTDIDHIDRGYPNIEETLRSLGADIVRV